MVLSSGTLFWISFLFISSFQLQVQAREFQYSSKREDYDFGWIVSTLANGSVPTCSYCVNALYKATKEAINRKVGMYRCDGVQMEEMWAYHNLTKAIVFSNVTGPILCIDAIAENNLRLRPCNSSAVTQRWTLNGNQVISGLVNSSGGSHFEGSFPTDIGAAVKSEYPLVTSKQSTSPTRGNDYTSTDNFKFLSSKTFLNESTNRFTIEGLLQITNSPPDQITNGGFESSTIPTGGDGVASYRLIQSTPSYFAFCGWVMDYGPFDYVRTDHAVPSKEGKYSVHLNTFTEMESKSASISQTSKMQVGKDYNLSFFFRAFPKNLANVPKRSYLNCSTTYKEARLQLLVTNARTGHRNSTVNGSVSMINFTVDAGIEEWKSQIVKFKALANVTTITFKSLNVDVNDSCGPMIDDVKLSSLGKRNVMGIVLPVVISIGGVLILAVVIGVLGLIYRKWYCGSEDYSGLYKIEHARVFSKKEITVATKKFSSVLGEGTFGTVYKADFPDGTAGAIKVEKPAKNAKVPSEEIAVLLRVHHRNLVNLTGFCIHKGRHMLVFEYLPHGSLYDRLHESRFAPPSRRQVSVNAIVLNEVNAIELKELCDKTLPWQARVKIASDVAYGLEYLHHDADPPIVHRDVKSQNILLTSIDSAKLADFGLSKAAPEDATAFESIETIVKGSIGYLDPQYFLTGVFSTKSDVYSYGVVLLEVITGHRAIYNRIPLASWAAPYMASPSLYHQLVDKKLNGMFEANELHSLVELSKMCMHEDGRMRPNMRQVVAFLNNRQLVVVGGPRAHTHTEAIVDV